MNRSVFGGRFQVPHLAILRGITGGRNGVQVYEHESEVWAGCEASKDLLKLHLCTMVSALRSEIPVKLVESGYGPTAGLAGQALEVGIWLRTRKAQYVGICTHSSIAAAFKAALARPLIAKVLRITSKLACARTRQVRRGGERLLGACWQDEVR
jgi:hypothetical protein